MEKRYMINFGTNDMKKHNYAHQILYKLWITEQYQKSIEYHLNHQEISNKTHDKYHAKHKTHQFA